MSELILTPTSNKDKNIELAMDFIYQIEEGKVNPLDALLQVKSIEHLLDQFTNTKYTLSKRFKSLVLEEAEKHGKQFDYKGAEISIKEAGTTYDYSVCGDTKLNEMYATLKTLQADIKEREAMLRTLPETGMADPETGVVLYPPTKHSATIVQCKIK